MSGDWFKVFLLAALMARPAMAEDLPQGVVSVYYAFRLEQNRLITGESFCHVERDCELNFDVDPVGLTLLVGARDAAPDLRIDCRDVARKCQLRESQPPTDLLREMGVHGFRIFAVSYDDGGFLVEQRQIGTVTLQVRKPKPNPARGI